jgi:hypothetical protein
MGGLVVFVVCLVLIVGLLRLPEAGGDLGHGMADATLGGGGVMVLALVGMAGLAYYFGCH